MRTVSLLLIASYVLTYIISPVDFFVLFLSPSLDPPRPLPPAPAPPTDPCNPNQCGPYSICKSSDPYRAACTCQPNYVGAPPNCRPECIRDSDCLNTQNCAQGRCRNPCNGACGVNALCTATNHQGICKCAPGFDGDPYTGGCSIVSEPVLEDPSPCEPNPCGSNAQCTAYQRVGACTCLPGYFGDAYSSCR